MNWMLNERAGYVETQGREFTGNLYLHVRDHQQQTLRSCVSSSQRTGLQSRERHRQHRL